MGEIPSDSSEVQSFHFPDFGDAETTSVCESSAQLGRSRLRIEYGRVEVLRTESASWQSGTTIVLPHDHAELVTVFVDGDAIARGELVEMDGKLGVRIRELISSVNADERRSA